MLRPETLCTLDQSWSARLGCRLPGLLGTRTVVAAHGKDLAGYFGVEVFRRNDACVVSTPPDLLATVGATMGSLAPANAFHAEVLAGVLGARLYRVVGPTWFSYTDEAGFKPAVPRDVRPLKPKDKETLLELAMACPPDEWEAAGFEVGQTGLFGGFVGSELACVGRAARFGEGIVGIGVITRPARRGQGLATALVSDLTRRTLEQGFVPQLRMDAENQAAVSMAMALGYEPYAATLVARLR